MGKKMQNSLIGKTVVIKTVHSAERGNWGIVKYFDGEDYHVSMNGNDNQQLTFYRHEFTVKKFDA